MQLFLIKNTVNFGKGRKSLIFLRKNMSEIGIDLPKSEIIDSEKKAKNALKKIPEIFKIASECVL